MPAAAGTTAPEERSAQAPAEAPGDLPGPRGSRAAPPGGPFPTGAVTSASAAALSVLRPGQELALSGRLDVRTAADVRLALVEHLGTGAGDLVLDCAGVHGVDAPGLGVLVGVHRRAGRAGRTLVLRDVPPAVARLLLLTRLDRVLRVSSASADRSAQRV